MLQYFLTQPVPVYILPNLSKLKPLSSNILLNAKLWRNQLLSLLIQRGGGKSPATNRRARDSLTPSARGARRPQTRARARSVRGVTAEARPRVRGERIIQTPA